MADQYEELRRLSAEATPVPWTILPFEADKTYIRIRGTRLGMRYKIANVNAENFTAQDEVEALANARLIVAAVNALPSIFAELDALREDARRMDFLAAQQDVCWQDEGGYWHGTDSPNIREAIDARCAALHPSKDADSGEVGNG